MEQAQQFALSDNPNSGTPSNNDNDDEKSIIPVDKLVDQGIAQILIDKLKQNNFNTVNAIICSRNQLIANIQGISDINADKICTAAYNLMKNKLNLSFRPASSIKKDVVKITTGSSKFDDILEGGIVSGSITEISGPASSGKTQLCHMLCVTCQFPIQSGGAEGCALYIDSQGTFRPKRVEQMAGRYGMDTNDLLDNISFARAYSSDHQMKLLQEAAQMMTQSHYALVIVDSVTALFRSEYVGRGELAIRQQALGKFLRQLLMLCDIFGVAVVITNQIVSDPGGMSFGPNTKAIGGNIIGHASTTRIAIRKVGKIRRIAKIYDSPILPEAESNFAITNDGIVDE